MPEVGSITFPLNVETRGFNRGIERAQDRLRDYSRTAQKAIKRTGALASAMSAAAAGALAAFATMAARDAKELRNLSYVAGTTVEEFQRLSYAADTVGISSGKLADVYKDVQDRVGDFLTAGAGPMVDFFEQIAPKVGVTAEQFRHLSGPEALQLFVDSLDKANVSQSEMIFHMEAVAGDASYLIPLLEQNGKGMKKLGEEADRMGVILSDIEVGQLNQMSREFKKIGEMASSAISTIGVQLAPIIKEIGERMADAGEETNGFRSVVETSVDVVLRGFTAIADVIEGVRRSVRLLREAFIFMFAVQNRESLKISIALEKRIGGTIDSIAKRLNNLPWFNIETGSSEQNIKDMEGRLKIAEDQAEESKKRMNKIMMEPLPSDVFKKWRESAENESKSAARAYIEAREEMRKARANAEGVGGDSEEEDAGGVGEGANKGLRKRLEQERMMLMRQLGFKREVAQKEYEQRLEQIEKLAETDAEEREMKAVAARKFEQRMTEINKAGLEQREKDTTTVQERIDRFLEMSQREQAEHMIGIYKSMTAQVQREHKAFFRVYQAASIAETIMDTQVAAMKAYRWAAPFGGPPAGAAAAAVASAAGAARVAQIASQSFEGGGSGGTGAGAGGGGGSGAGTQQAQQQQAPTRQATIQLESGALYSDRQVEELANRLNEFAGDNGDLRVNVRRAN